MAVPAAAVVILTGALPLDQARDEAGRLLPVLAFLGAILVVAHVCQRDGLFTAAGARLARLGSPARLLRGVFGLAAMTTALLSLDTTVVLLTPVVHDTAARLRMRPKPHVYACTHLANSASTAAAGVQPDQPARVLGGRADTDPVRRADGRAVAGRDRRGVPGVPLVLRRRSPVRDGGCGPGSPGGPSAGPAVHRGGAGGHAGRAGARLAGRAEPGLGRGRRCGRAGRLGAGPRFGHRGRPAGRGQPPVPAVRAGAGRRGRGRGAQRPGRRDRPGSRRAVPRCWPCWPWPGWPPPWPTWSTTCPLCSCCCPCCAAAESGPGRCWPC